MNFKNIVWFIKTISYFMLVRSLGNISTTLPKQGLMSITMAQVCTNVLNICTFRSRPMENNNVKGQSSTNFGECSHDGKFFKLSVTIDCWHYVISLSEVLNRLAYGADS